MNFEENVSGKFRHFSTMKFHYESGDRLRITSSRQPELRASIDEGFLSRFHFPSVLSIKTSTRQKKFEARRRLHHHLSFQPL